MNRTKTAFTLVELLVVIAVMAILIAILMPALSKAREQARTIKCRTNLYGFGKGYVMYLDDNNGFFPPAYSWLYKTQLYDANYRRRIIGRAGADAEKLQQAYSTLNQHFCRWHDKNVNLDNVPQFTGVFWPYVSDRDISLCPTFDKIASTGIAEFHAGHTDGIPIDPQYNYSMNGYLGSSWMGVVKKIGNIKKNPAQVFSFTEENVMFNIPSRSAIYTISFQELYTANTNNGGGGTDQPFIGEPPAPEEITIMDLSARFGNFIVPGLNVIISRSFPYFATNYSGAFATYHNPPSTSIRINEVNPDGNVVLDAADKYPDWGLCRGSGNAVFLDQHVESMPYNVDTHQYAWPMRGINSRQYVPKFYWQR
ncbi:MAG: type II secretion system protein [Planctomycetes bacterium]|nr:type II secretion system protein [Planctomycetota bacterium]